MRPAHLGARIDRHLLVLLRGAAGNPVGADHLVALEDRRGSAAGRNAAIGHGGEAHQQLRIAFLEPLLDDEPVRQFLRPIDLESPTNKRQEACGDMRVDPTHSEKAETNHTNTNIARSFLRLTSLDDRVLERLGRYETSLWRQTIQILLLLSSIEFRAKEPFPDERPHFRRVHRKYRRYPPFDFDPFLRSAGRLR